MGDGPPFWSPGFLVSKSWPSKIIQLKSPSSFTVSLTFLAILWGSSLNLFREVQAQFNQGSNLALKDREARGSGKRSCEVGNIAAYSFLQFSPPTSPHLMGSFAFDCTWLIDHIESPNPRCPSPNHPHLERGSTLPLERPASKPSQ